eukprot:jgi/Undpi1/13169/HiC_scaffold_8.g02831.m1
MLDAKACSAQDQGREGGVSYKGRHDLVTETDRSNEALIQRGLKQAFPQDRFLGEETSAAAAAAETTNGVGGATPLKAVEDGVEMVWIVDPIDGTTNFVHGFPVTCVSIALATRGEVIVGVVYNPFTKELYQSVKGNGSFLNGDPLEASGKTKMDQAMVVAEYSCVREEESISKMMKTTGSIACTARAVRQTGCGAMDLCFLARGAVDAVFGGVAGVWKPWDWAAGVLIAKEAGAVILAGDGGQFRLMGDTILGAATPVLASSLTSQLNAL